MAFQFLFTVSRESLLVNVEVVTSKFEIAGPFRHCISLVGEDRKKPLV